MIFFALLDLKPAEMHGSGKGKIYTNWGKIKTFIFQIQGQMLEFNHLIKINHLKIT